MSIAVAAAIWTCAACAPEINTAVAAPRGFVGRIVPVAITAEPVVMTAARGFVRDLVRVLVAITATVVMMAAAVGFFVGDFVGVLVAITLPAGLRAARALRAIGEPLDLTTDGVAGLARAAEC